MGAAPYSAMSNETDDSDKINRKKALDQRLIGTLQ
jgi:hypothetical protein